MCWSIQFHISLNRYDWNELNETLSTHKRKLYSFGFNWGWINKCKMKNVKVKSVWKCSRETWLKPPEITGKLCLSPSNHWTDDIIVSWWLVASAGNTDEVPSRKHGFIPFSMNSRMLESGTCYCSHVSVEHLIKHSQYFNYSLVSIHFFYQWSHPPHYS